MKTIAFKTLLAGFLSLSCLLLVSCSDDDSMSDSTVELPAAVITTYTGALTYTSATGNVITATDGTAKIEKSGSGYTIKFSDDVPSLEDLDFEEANGSYATVSGSNSVVGIVIDEDDLDVGVTQDGNVWAFSGSK